MRCLPHVTTLCYLFVHITKLLVDATALNHSHSYRVNVCGVGERG